MRAVPRQFLLATGLGTGARLNRCLAQPRINGRVAEVFAEKLNPRSLDQTVDGNRRAAKTRPSSNVPGASSSACIHAGCGWPAAASRSRRSSSPALASSPASSGRSRPSSHSGAPDHESLGLEQRMRPTTRRTLEASMRHLSQPVTRDARPRQLPTVTSHAVPTGECQSDPPSLPRTIRCSRPRATPSTRAGPLDLLLHVRGLM